MPMNPLEPELEVNALLSAGIALGDPKPVTADGYAMVPTNARIEDLEQFLARPRRIREKQNFQEVDSYIKYVMDWAVEGSTIIFADRTTFRFRAIFDYHTKPNAEAEEPGQPAFCNHMADFKAEHSEEWKAWAKSEGQPFSQDMFADFLEDHCVDVIEPEGASLLESVTDMRASLTGNFSQSVRLSDGSRSFSYTQNVDQVATGKKSIEVPEKMVINVPIFDRGDLYKIVVLLRFRITDGRLRFFYKLVDRQKIVDGVFDDLRKKIDTGTHILPLIAEVR